MKDTGHALKVISDCIRSTASPSQFNLTGYIEKDTSTEKTKAELRRIGDYSALIHKNMKGGRYERN